MPSRERGFVFTLNNYTEEEFLQLLETAQQHSKYYIFGKEVAPTTGTPHIQGYIYWKSAKTISASRKLLPQRVANHEPAKGSPEQNYFYCSKEKNFVSNMSYKLSNRCCKRLTMSCNGDNCGCHCHCDSCYLKKKGFTSWEELLEHNRNLANEHYESGSGYETD